MNNKNIDRLVEALTEERLTRREFVTRATALGLSVAGALSIAGTLGSREAFAAQVDRSKLSKELNIYN